MPELPEVESIRRGLARKVRGDVIESVWLGEKPEPLKSPAPEIVAALECARIAAVRRVGKHIVFELERPRPRAVAPRSQWIVHLGMTGSLVIARPESEIARHTHAIVRLRSGLELRFVDPRRFGRLSVVRDHGGFAPGGQEPLGAGVRQFARLFHDRNTPIKSALLNQKLLRGVGNIYADESLHRAGIRPRRRASRLTGEELARLHRAVQQVLREAIRAGGSSVSDYVNADGEPGFFQFNHRVYGREGEACRKCKAPIKRVVIAGRSAHYCPKCQR
ncbi:MAG: bifunctional DNA-formamidopyrimidine glycosylase/DNA-(apurinic or apyrimidinic site) lyase [Acidobacteriota bacterium]|nr:bifunctional DNA-formamidopyrimidine glycosylase/DNA-(apurinic or apyrimidinic site) lyase [Acidobacteriota bacterium]